MAIKIGSIDVPVLEEVILTGDVNLNQTANNILTQAKNKGWDTISFFQSAAELGFEISPARSLPSASPSTSCNMTGGRTGIHDDGELITTVTEAAGYDEDDKYYSVTVQAVQVQGQTTVEIAKPANNLSMINGHSGTTASSQTREVRIFAVRYKYPEDSDPSDYTKVFGYGIYSVDFRTTTPVGGNPTVSYNYGFGFLIDIPKYNKQNGTEFYYDEPGPEPGEDPFDPSDQDPYDPSGRDDTSDLIDIPSDPPIGVTSVGFINVYKPGIGALQGLGDILFPNVASATDIVDAVIKLCETFANSNLINYVIDCHVIPVTPVTGNNANIKVGFRDTGISVPVVTSDYANVSCGSLNLAEWFHGFQDYQATRSKLYLPFIGFTDMKPEYWQAGIIYVDYKFNIIDGSFMAYVRSNSSKSQLAGSIIAQFAGNACMHFPITGVNYAQMVSGIVGAGISAASSGGATAALGSALSAANTIAQGGDVQQSNGYNSTAAILGVRTPYLIIERAVPSYSSGYKHDKGYPSNIYTSLSGVTGYTEIEDIDLSGIPLTDTELTELRDLLKTGVYL